MSFSGKQITYHKPTVVAGSLNSGLRALAESYAGSITRATDHCLQRVDGLTDSRLARARDDGEKMPRYTRNGAIFITLVWVFLVDGVMPHRPADVVRDWFTALVNATDLFEDDLSEDDIPALVDLFETSLADHLRTDTPTRELITRMLSGILRGTSPNAAETSRTHPIYNRLFVGRDDELNALQGRLGLSDSAQRQSLTIVRGWPGVGKTALVNALLHADNVTTAFSEGILWAALGREGDLLTTLHRWATELGAHHLRGVEALPELIAGLRTALNGREILIVADDIWTVEQGQNVKQAVDLKSNTLLMTTRFRDVADTLSDRSGDVYVLDSLSEAHAIDLLRAIAPQPVSRYAHRMPGLVTAVERLPLALKVAAPLLNHYHQMGFDVERIITEFENDYKRLLNSIGPSDRFDEATGKTPTIELLFQRSVETLTADAHLAFAMLGVFQHKPATFAIAALADVWEQSPEPLITEIAGRGLMEPTEPGRFHVHQTLHMYADKLLDDYDAGLYG